jgi:imidazolonepropionase
MGGLIRWAGPAADLPADLARLPAHDLGGRLVTQALIDCRTHIVHGGHRAAAFEQHLMGASHTELAGAGGGILSTVRATRAAIVEDLVATALPRPDAVIAEGVTAVEVKPGYGLDTETEIRMLQATRALERRGR